MQLKICQRYKLPHGIGILVGYEASDPNRPGHLKCFYGEARHTDSYGRHIFRLEAGHTWSFDKTNSREAHLYAAWGKQIETLQ
jgi:hypothetical protein